MLIKPAWGINLRLVLEGLVNCNKQDTRLVRVAIEEIAGMPGLDLNKFAPRNEAKFIQNITEVVAENARSLRNKLAKATEESASCFPQIQNGNEVESVQEIEEKVTEVKLMHNKWSIYLFIFRYNFSVESARFYCLAWRIDFFLGRTNLNIMKRLISWTSVLFFIFPAYNGTGGFDEELLRFWDELVKIRECNGTSGLAVIPVYYNVDKYSLENQLETCAGGFDQLQQTGYTSSQRRAIEEIAGMPGLDLNKFAPRDESVCLHKLVETILSELKIINSIMDRTIPILDWNDIFISFRGQDSRKTFVSHLYTAFARAGISTFRDAADISRGQAISEVLEGAIQRTKIAVVVFTKHYADSQWCLNELVWINKRRKSGLLLVPAFYDVNPSVVRRQTKMYAEAFTRHGERMSDKVETWRKALADAADISGYAIQCNNGNEANFIQKITEVVAEKARSLRHKLAEATEESVSYSPQIQNGNEVESVQEIEEEVTKVKLMHNKWSMYPSSLDTTSQWNVFLSFRGVDTRKTFVSHLNAEMKHAGIKVFLDDDALRRGYKIKSGLFEAIEESKILIIVFSKNYASSKWCLDELVKILERQNTQEPMRQLVFPIFYDVDPRDVEKQEGSFKNAFEVHNRRYPKETVDIWRAALSEVGTLGGWDLQNSWDGREADLIQDVIAKVLHEITTNSK